MKNQLAYYKQIVNAGKYKIAQQFGYDYICEFDKRHQYKTYSKQSKKLYLKIFNQFYQQFSSIVSSIISSIILKIVPFSINENQITEDFTKKIMKGRLMTTFKLRDFILKKLQQHGFPYGITLKQFYDRCNKQIILNFVVVNSTKSRLDFLNKITSPNMPVWAAIVAASTLPCLHRPFQSEKNWQDLEGESFKTNQMLDFFQHSSIFKRKYTSYNSSMYISSIPMELLSNNTFVNRYEQLGDEKDEHLKNLNRIGFAFDKTYQTNLQHMKIDKKYFNFTTSMVITIIMEVLFQRQMIVTKKDQKQYQQHFNRSYELKFSPFQFLKKIIVDNNISAMTLWTIIQSNDNLIMKWYSDKLIRLPIKIDTLDFDKTIKKKILKKYKLRMPSYFAKESLIRSEQITKTFIHNIQKRFKLDKRNYYKTHSQSERQRFMVKLKAQIILAPSKQSNFDFQHCRVIFLNHSKWNQNMYSNFIIQYKIQNLQNKQVQMKRCNNSQIFWRIQQGSQLLVKFYYLHYHKYQQNANKNNLNEDYISSKNSKIKYSQFILDFRNIFKELPARNSYEYQFQYAWNQQQEQRKHKQQGQRSDKWMNQFISKIKQNNNVEFIQNELKAKKNQEKQRFQQQKKRIIQIDVHKINNIANINTQGLPRLIIRNQIQSQKQSQKVLENIQNIKYYQKQIQLNKNYKDKYIEKSKYRL